MHSVFTLNQERFGLCLEDGKGLPIFETVFAILIRQWFSLSRQSLSPLESLQPEECHPIIQYGASSELHRRVYMFLYPAPES